MKLYTKRRKIWMVKYLNKIKSDYEYISKSEQYIIACVRTYITIYNTITFQSTKLMINDIEHICVTVDDRYAFFSQIYSGYLYIYDLFRHELKPKKCIKRSMEIISINQYDENKILLVLENKHKLKKYKERYYVEYVLYLYDFKEDQLINIKIPSKDIFEIESIPIIKNNNIIYRCCIKEFDKDIIKKVFYKVQDGKFVEVELSQEDANNTIDIVYSKDYQYYAKIFNKTKKVEDILLDKNQSGIYIYDSNKNNEIMNIHNRCFNSEMEVLFNFYRGSFIVDEDKNHIFYTPNNKTVELYYVEKNKTKILEFHLDIMNVYISYQYDYIMIRVAEMNRCFCYIYKLSSFL